MPTDLSPPEEDYTFTRGDTQPFAIERVKDDGTPYDITNWTFWFTLKSNPDDDDADAVIGPKKNTTHKDAANGLTEFTLTESETSGLSGSYNYDVQQKRPDGTIQTILAGRVFFEADVTEETA